MNGEEKKLYPMRFLPLEDTYSWGKDEFKLADLGYRDSLVKDGWLAANTISEVMDTYMDRIVGDNVYPFFGRQFPVQLKVLHVQGKMPLRVHPDDTTAQDRYDALGKDKLWYVASASKGATLYLGLKRDVEAQDILDGSFVGSLNEVHPLAGQSFLIPAGTIHGAEGKMEIVEVSESSALDFCVWSWGEPADEDEFDPALDVVEALDFICLKPFSEPEPCHHHDTMIEHLAECEQFKVSKIALKDPLHIYSEKLDSFSLYLCLYGEACVRCEFEGIGAQDYRMKAGETLLVPAEVPDFYLVPMQQTTSLLEVIMEERHEIDSYTGECEHHHHEDEEEYGQEGE